MKAMAIGTSLLLMTSVTAPVLPQLDDPTRPPDTKRAEAASKIAAEPVWRVNSTLISPQRRVAVVNGKTVGVGDFVDGAKVVKINRASVRLAKSGTRFTVYLPRLSIKRPPGRITAGRSHHNAQGS